jgi:hypothetical protein
MQYGDIWVYKSNYKKDYYTCVGIKEDVYDLIGTFTGETFSNYQKETFERAKLSGDWIFVCSIER